MTTDSPNPSLRSRLMALLPGASRERAPFVDGLMLGAMVGAAIAGSTLWTRWRARREAPPTDPTPRADRDGDRPG